MDYLLEKNHLYAAQRTQLKRQRHGHNISYIQHIISKHVWRIVRQSLDKAVLLGRIYNKPRKRRAAIISKTKCPIAQIIAVLAVLRDFAA